MDADDDRLLDAYLGPHFRNGFDVRAALTPLWPASRGYWAFQLATFVIWIAVAYVALRLGGWVNLLIPPIVATLAVMILHGIVAGRLRLSYAEHTRAKLAARGITGDEAVAHLQRAGSVQWLTLILMALVALVPISYVLYPALFRDEHYEERRIEEMRMTYDLNDLVMRQMGYFDRHGRYAGSVDSLGYDDPPYNVSIVAADSTGWSAESRDRLSQEGRCAVFVGSAAPLIPRSRDGVVKCEGVTGH